MKADTCARARQGRRKSTRRPEYMAAARKERGVR